jgi:hypothetical protein
LSARLYTDQQSLRIYFFSCNASISLSTLRLAASAREGEHLRALDRAGRSVFTRGVFPNQSRK